MKRSMKYYPMPTNIMYDSKTHHINLKYGSAGVTLYLYMFCKIFGTEGYYLKIDKNMLIDMDWEICIDVEHILEILEFFTENNYFSKELYEKYSIITSEEIQSVYAEAVKRIARFNQITVENKYWLLKDTPDYIDIIDTFSDSITEEISDEVFENVNNSEINPVKTPVNSGETGVISELIGVIPIFLVHNSTNKSKVNKIKVNKSKVNGQNPPCSKSTIKHTRVIVNYLLFWRGG